MDLCYLESLGNARFSRTSLSLVRLWSVRKLTKSVQEWCRLRNKSDNTLLTFPNPSPEALTPLRRKASTERDPLSVKPLVEPRAEWKEYAEFSKLAAKDTLPTIQTTLLKEKSTFVATTNAGVILQDSHTKNPHILRRVQEDLNAGVEKGEENPDAFDLAAYIKRNKGDAQTTDSNNLAVVAQGGSLQHTLSLDDNDINAIHKGSRVSDEAMVFVVSFLSNWSSESINSVNVVDPILTGEWWEKPLTTKSAERRGLRDNLNMRLSW